MSIANLIEKFRAVALERVEKMNVLVVELERNPTLTEQEETLLREVHTLKGEAKMMGFADVNLVAHLTEHLVQESSRRSFDVPSRVLDLMFEGFDILRSLLTKSAGGHDAPIDLTGFVDRVTEARLDFAGREALSEASEASELVEEERKPEPKKIQVDGLLRIQTGTSLRVDLSKVEQLGDLAGEVLLSSRRIDYELERLEEQRESLRALSNDAQARLGRRDGRALQRISRVIDDALSELEEHVYATVRRTTQIDEEARNIRHVRLAQVLSHYPRAVRDLARSLDKDVHFVTEFGDVEVDRAILGGLADPLLHLVRNAVGHGIEPPAEREEAGKEPEGTIRLEAHYVGNNVTVELSDDGRGIVPEFVRKKAVEKGIITQERADALSSQEVVNLVFEAGFSTRDTVDDVSGRGIGMDVVRRQITALGGTVDIESTPGEGTTFLLTLPISSAITNLLMVTIDGNPYGIPAKDVERVDLVSSDELSQFDHGGWCMRMGQDLIGLHDWSAALGDKARVLPPGKEITVLLLRRGSRFAAVWVDDVMGEREAVMRPLGEFLAGIRECRGMALTSAGEVVPVLNVSELLSRQHTNLADSGEHQSVRTTMAHSAVRPSSTILVVEDSEVTRALVVGILRGLGYRVLEADDGRVALDVLERSRVDLIVTDIQMPRIDGLELIQRLRDDTRFKSTPIIVLSTLGSDEDKERAMRSGANGYLVKLNFREQELLDAVRRFID